MKRPMLMPAMVFGLLGLNVCIVGVTVYLAHNDASFAVEPDYYRQAMAWNATAAQQRRNAELGWTAGVGLGGTRAGERSVSVRLSGRDGAPIRGAAVDLVTFHSARAGRRLAATLMESADGRYETTLPIDRPGEWEFRLSVRRGAVTFTASEEL